MENLCVILGPVSSSHFYYYRSIPNPGSFTWTIATASLLLSAPRLDIHTAAKVIILKHKSKHTPSYSLAPHYKWKKSEVLTTSHRLCINGLWLPLKSHVPLSTTFYYTPVMLSFSFSWAYKSHLHLCLFASDAFCPWNTLSPDLLKVAFIIHILKVSYLLRGLPWQF